jgi:hypothetical protein
MKWIEVDENYWARLKHYQRHRQRLLDKLPPLFFGPRWISRFIVRSIQLCGDMRLAFDLMEKEKT